MHLRLWHRLFLAFACLSGLLLGGFAAWQQWNFRSGFADYLDAVAQQHLHEASARFAAAYREHGSWDFLRGGPQVFDQLLDPAAAPHDRPPGAFDAPPPPPDRDDPAAHSRWNNGPSPSASRAAPPQPPDAIDLRHRTLLVDIDLHRVAGFGSIAPDSPSVPIDVLGRTVGTLYLSPLPKMFEGLDLAFASTQGNAALLAGCIALFIALLLAFAIARWLLAPVRALADGLHALTAGDFARRVPAQGSDELGALARDFNHLAQTLEQHRDARRRWGADLAHELRTPLTVLQGEIAALQDGVRAATPQAFDSLAAECMRLAGLVEDLNQLALADAGALEYRFEPLDLRDIIDDAVALLEPACTDTGLRLDWNKPAQAFVVEGDARRLSQLFDNLLGNARRYTDAPGRIRIACEDDGGRAHITIDDTPPAPPDSDLLRLRSRPRHLSRDRDCSPG